MSLPETRLELGHIWKDLLQLENVDPEDNFFELGGDSLTAIRLSSQVQRRWSIDLPMGLIFEAPTLNGMAALIDGEAESTWSPRVAPLKPDGKRTPFLCVDAGPFFLRLVQRLNADQPFFGLRLDSTTDLPVHFSLEDIASYHVASIREIQPKGPYCLGGWSASGLIAYEAAQQLRSQGEEVSLLVLFDSTNSTGLTRYTGFKKLQRTAGVLSWKVRDFISTMWNKPGALKLTYLRAVLSERTLNMRRACWSVADRIQRSISRQIAIAPRDPSKAVFVASQRYHPKPYSGRVLLLRSAVQYDGPYQDRELGWNGLIHRLDICDMPGGHDDMFAEPYVHELAAQLEERFSVLPSRRFIRRRVHSASEISGNFRAVSA